MNDPVIIKKLNSLPQNLRSEVEDFIDFLLSKIGTNISEKKPKRKFGSAKGTIVLPDDFDAPMEDFKEYME